jgi:hypothetical protein
MPNLTTLRKRVSFVAVADLLIQLDSTLLPQSKRRPNEWWLQKRYVEYGIAVPILAAYSAEPARMPGKRIYAGLCPLSDWRNHRGAVRWAEPRG